MMTIIASLISIIFGLLAVVSYLFGKKSVGDALLKNNDVKEELNKISESIVKNQGQIDAAQEELERRKNEEASQEDLLNKFNRSDKP